MSVHLLTADILVPMDASRSVLTDAGVAIDGDAIVSVGVREKLL